MRSDSVIHTLYLSGFNTLLTHRIEEDTEMSDRMFSANGISPADIQQ